MGGALVVLIPAYEPDRRLVDLVALIEDAVPGQVVVIVDDGSGDGYAPVFAEARAAGAGVIGYAANRGKGWALRSGFAYIEATYPGHDVVCADCDGQHTVVDILRVADALATHDAAVVLGARQFVGDVPVRSRFGNSVTRIVFDVATGHRLQDTQTGLRGHPAELLGWLQTIGGDRFEYELDVLLEAERQHLEVLEVPIETVYLEGNESSHFRTIRDSFRVYVPIVKFSLSSLAAFAIDAVLFFVLMAITADLALSVVVARVVSASVNFTVNRTLVFAADRGDRGGGERRGDRRRAALRYGSLVVALMAANYALLALLTVVGPVPLVPAKLLTELTLFIVSYQVQHRVVFRSQAAAAVDSVSDPARIHSPTGG